MLEAPILASGLFAVSTAAAAQDRYLDEIVVTAAGIDPERLDAPAPVASGLGLTALETPASLDVVDLADQARRGARTLAEATRGVTGLTFTTRAGAPGVFASRGFTENALVTLYDGLRVQSATISARPYDPFNFERIEVLRGPASLVYGEGATAGAVNYVRRKPRLGPLQVEGLAEIGEQDRLHAGLALAGGITETIGVSLSGSYQDYGSFIESTDTETGHVVASLGGQIGPETGFLVEADYLTTRTDDPYFGSPVIAGRIDARVFRRNYNQSPDNRMADDVLWLRALVTHTFSDVLDYRGQAYFYEADRDWRVFYAFSYVPGTPEQIEARNVETLAYDHGLWGTRHDLKLTADLGRVESRTVLSFDHSDTDFSSPRRDGAPSTGVPRPRFDVDAPQPAPFLQGPRLRQREADIAQTGVSLEQRLALGRLSFIGGVRVTWIDGTIARPEAIPAVAPFDVRYNPIDWRTALVFQPTPHSSLYATVTSGAEPVESLLLLPLAQADFRLSKSTGYEIGYKLEAGGFELTAAGYILNKDRLPSVNPADPNLPPQVGEQRAKGFELSGRYRGRIVSLGANLAYVDAEFREFNDFGAFRDGVRPANVPEWVMNAEAEIRPIEPVSIGAFLQHVSSRPSSNANTLFLPGYTTVDAFVEWRVSPRVRLIGRAVNLLDERYVEWATQTFGQNNLYFGSPRRFETSVGFRF
ncbi:TonB-dependent receptor [Sphingosinicella sp. LHD-64]|uniref:TonB-dependent receptor n=1 Tax=Sphingosinicella sp. LHD-64 TaxID=3072139 RepID=UPI0028100B22|nr:TonB-dependent receptor [Sphingosinicella sp. LHD-64]MDQ8755374.1 TonB-dependent receptor [Sphingosinicella sp. LHD-64]